ncbi:specific peptidase [Cyanidiococcus yangmingshanensis]|uniref:Specific peptidase n=1 Tax=Cyanidiococcus yangmingshanensis TaxID=2690220 RepID=A0A7J7IJ39_9RHOD|nr:specific peptidase [Cyanidiococcus yangmingshanensis]
MFRGRRRHSHRSLIRARPSKPGTVLSTCSQNAFKLIRRPSRARQARVVRSGAPSSQGYAISLVSLRRRGRPRHARNAPAKTRLYADKTTRSRSAIEAISWRDNSLHRYGRTNGRQELTPSERDLLRWAWSHSTREQILSRLCDVQICLRGCDLRCLRHPGWLNDEIMNAYMGMLNRQYRSQGVYCFNSFFYTRLTSPSYRFEFVHRWTRRAGLCIQRNSLLLVPVNVDQRHWILVAIDASRRELRCYDSMHSRDGWRVLPNLERWLYDELTDKRVKDPWLLSREWRTLLAHEHQPVPRQSDGGSCGVFSLLFAEALACNWPPERSRHLSPSKGVYCKFSFGQKDVPVLRKRIALELLQQRLER